MVSQQTSNSGSAFNSQKSKNKRQQEDEEYAKKSDIPKFLYDEIPINLNSTALNSQIHNTATHDTLSSPYPSMERRRKLSSASSHKGGNADDSKFTTTTSPTKKFNLTVNTNLDGNGNGGSRSSPNFTNNGNSQKSSPINRLINSKKSIEKFDTANLSPINGGSSNGGTPKYPKSSPITQDHQRNQHRHLHVASSQDQNHYLTPLKSSNNNDSQKSSQSSPSFHTIPSDISARSYHILDPKSFTHYTSDNSDMTPSQVPLPEVSDVSIVTAINSSAENDFSYEKTNNLSGLIETSTPSFDNKAKTQEITYDDDNGDNNKFLDVFNNHHNANKGSLGLLASPLSNIPVNIAKNKNQSSIDPNTSESHSPSFMAPPVSSSLNFTPRYISPQQSPLDTASIHSSNYINFDASIPNVPHHSHNDSITSQTSLNSRKIRIGSKAVNSPHSKQSSISWSVNIPEEWTLERVTYWLTLYEFNESWLDAFKKNNIIGSKFLNMASYEKLSHYFSQLDISGQSTPSRFIHLLRKTIDRSNSEVVIRMPSPNIEGADGQIKNKIVNSDGSKGEKVNGLYWDNGRETQSVHNRSISHKSSDSSVLTGSQELVPITSAPVLTSNDYKKAPTVISVPISNKSSSRAGNNAQRGNSQSRPFSTIEGSNKTTFSPPTSPASFSHGFFRKHMKSNSSESSILTSIFANNSSAHNSFRNGSDHDLKASSPISSLKTEVSTTTNNSPVTESNTKRGLIHKLRKKVSDITNEPSRKRSFKQGTSSPISPVSTTATLSNTLIEPAGANKKSQKKKLEKIVTATTEEYARTKNNVFEEHKKSTKSVETTNSKDENKTSPILNKNPNFSLPLKKATTSNGESNKLENLSPLKFVVERRFQPKSLKRNSDLFILITKDNKTFVPCNIGLINSLFELKAEISKELNLSNLASFSMHLTDFGCEEGEPLDDTTLEKLIACSFYGGSSKLLVNCGSNVVTTNNRNNDLSLSVSSTRSSIAQSYGEVYGDEGNRYPATPQYLLDASRIKESTDYLNFKEILSDKKENVQLKMKDDHGENAENAAGASISNSSVGSGSTNSRTASVSSSSKAHIAPLITKNSSNFRVIRKESVGEIDFDKKRESPFQRKTSLIAKRNAPPPPLSAQKSDSDIAISDLKERQLSSKSSTLSTEKNDIINSDQYRLFTGSTATSTLVASPVTEISESSYLSPFTPGSSNTLIPQPYRGNISSVSRKPVGSEEEMNTFETKNSANQLSAVNSLSNKNKGSNAKFSRNSYSLRRNPSVRSVTTVKDKFKENTISFEGAPALSDESDDSDSDDGLWAKVPSKEKSSESIHVVRPLVRDEQKKSPNTGLQLEIPKSPNKQMTVRPPAEVVYDNLERFFPNTDLDKPILDVMSSPPVSPVAEASPTNPNPPPSLSSKKQQRSTVRRPVISRKVSSADDEYLKLPEDNRANIGRNHRMKTIRVVAAEANEARKRLSESANAKNKGGLLRRTSTKMWGQKVVEVTPNQLKRGYVSKLKNHNGEYKQFAWIKGELIGKGTFGKVFLALNVTTGEMMAVKQVEVPKNSIASAQITEVIDALHSEVETMKDLDHLNIVQYLGFEKVDNIYSLFLEYVAGGSVGSCIRMFGRFEESLIRFLTAQVLQGLAYLHKRGILHRDLKADNLLLEIDGVCKISDFGISKRSQNIYANDAEMSMQGTIFWMAPEVIDNVVHNKKQGYSAKIDIWSLGCVVLEMFAGRRPWSNVEAIGAIYKLGKTKLAPPIPEDTLPFVSKEGKDFIKQCFQIDPEKRPTASQLLKHPFCAKNPDFKFDDTKLAKKIKFNDKHREHALRLEAKKK